MRSIRKLDFAEILEEKIFSAAVVSATTSPGHQVMAGLLTSRDPAVADTNCEASDSDDDGAHPGEIA